MKEIKEHDGWEMVEVAGSTVGKNAGAWVGVATLNPKLKKPNRIEPNEPELSVYSSFEIQVRSR